MYGNCIAIPTLNVLNLVKCLYFMTLCYVLAMRKKTKRSLKLLKGLFEYVKLIGTLTLNSNRMEP